MEATKQFQATISDAPFGALVGAIVGYMVAKKIGRDKTITVISFISVGIAIGTIIGAKYK